MSAVVLMSSSVLLKLENLILGSFNFTHSSSTTAAEMERTKPRMRTRNTPAMLRSSSPVVSPAAEVAELLLPRIKDQVKIYLPTQ